MKKILLIAALTLSFTVGMQAAQISVTCAQLSLGSNAAPLAIGNSGNLTCTGFPALPVGTTINSIAFSQTTDYNIGQVDTFNPGTSALAIQYTMTVPGTVFDALLTNRDYVRGTTVNPLLQTSASASYSDYSPSNFVLGVTITGVTNDAQSFVQQAIFDGAFRVDYTLPTNGNEIPEPTTVALIGAGLVGLATAARRRR